MIKAIIFDFGGVIIKTTTDIIREDFANAFDTTPEKISEITNETVDDYLKGKVDDEEVKKTFEIKLGKEFEDFVQLWTKQYGSKGFFEKNIQLIKNLKKNGYKTACLSNTVEPYSKYNRKNKNYEFFDVVVLSCEVGMRKPNADIYEYTLKKLKVKPEEAVFIDDNLNLVEAAEKIGIKGIQFTTEEKLKKDLIELGIKI